MMVGKVTLGRASAMKTKKKRKRAKELNQSTIGGFIKKKEKILQRCDQFDKDLTGSERRNGSHLTKETPRAFKTFENPIGRITELLFSPRVNPEHFVNTNDKDTLCHLISSLFNTSDKNDSQFVPKHKDTKSLTVVKDKLLKGNTKQARMNTKTEHVSRKKKHRKQKSEKYEKKIDINKQILDAIKLSNVNCERELNTNGNCKYKSEKHEKKIDRNKQKLDAMKLSSVNCEHELNTNANCKYKSEKHEKKIDRYKQKLDAMKLSNVNCEHELNTNANCKSRGISKFSYQNGNEILTELMDKCEDSDKMGNKHLKQERMYKLGRGDGKLSVEYLTYMKSQSDECRLTSDITNDHIMKQIHNLGNMIQFSRSQMSYGVQFWGGNSPAQPPSPRSTLSYLFETSHFRGKALDIGKGSKNHKYSIVNQPVDDQEFWQAGPKLAGQSYDLFQKEEKETCKETVELDSGEFVEMCKGVNHKYSIVNQPVDDQEFWDAGPKLAGQSYGLFQKEEKETCKETVELDSGEFVEEASVLVKDNYPEPILVHKKKKRNKCVKIIRTCLCLGNQKSSSEISDEGKSPVRKHDEISRQSSGKNLARSDKFYMTAVGKHTNRLQKPKKRPSLKTKTAKGRNKKRPKTSKSSKVTCSIEWKGHKVGEILIGKRNKRCLQFKIGKWTQTNDVKDGEKSYALEVFLIPNE